ncbi:MAG: hypothetical protein KatS3mg060_3151 [Dehalococcoidia bacterium]|nr:MAG: hypothetical protein KatS3mg060_3151 [Dehalococcoidia bacterium]
MTTSDPPTPSLPDGPSRRDGLRPEWVTGAILIVVGGLFLVAQVIPNASQFIVLLVGLGLLTAALLTRNYGLLIPGGIVSGVGVGILLAATSSEPVSGALFLFALAAGFALIWVIGLAFGIQPPQGAWWPLIPAFFIALAGVLSLGGETVAWVWQYGWPVVLIAVGAFLLIRAVLRRQA